MAALSPILRSVADNHVGFWCPGCDEAHVLRVGGDQHPCWGYNGEADKPTFTPSILVRREGPTWKSVCHSFVRDGRIEFLGDCTHALAGQTVDLPEWDQ